MAEIKARENSLLEKGDTYFLYRPRVGVEKVNGFQDVELSARPATATRGSSLPKRLHASILVAKHRRSKTM